MGKIEVIIQAILAALLAYTYFKLCTNRESTFFGKVMEISSMYGVSILAFMGKIRFWTFLAGFVVIGIIKLLTTKKVKCEGQHTGMDL